MMTLHLDEQEVLVVEQLIKTNISMMTAAKAPAAAIDAAFDFLKKCEDFLSACGEEAEQQKYNHIDYTNWAE